MGGDFQVRRAKYIGKLRAFTDDVRIWALLAVWPMIAAAQSQGTADRVIAENPHTATIVDKILSMVGPSDPKVLNGKERFQQYLLNTVGPVPLFGEALSAGINQWSNTPGEWGQGWGAYGKRFANNLGYNAVRQTIAFGVGSVLHEDSRYFASREHGFWPRTKHAIVSTLSARHPDGSRSFSVSSLAGIAGGVAVQSTWGPPSMQNARSMGVNAGISLATSAGFNMVREFLPDLLHRRK